MFEFFDPFGLFESVVDVTVDQDKLNGDAENSKNKAGAISDVWGMWRTEDANG